MPVRIPALRMRRTQIYLPPDLSAALDRLARLRGTSRAELLRLAARQFVEREAPAEEDPIVGIVNLGDAGPGRAAVAHNCMLMEHASRGSAR
jgi:metal-responsive CopG/Arc/MetJ family transcriptional regulator